MSDKYKVGQVVFLRSGSVPLTITKMVDGQATCSWFDIENSGVFSHQFPQECLDEAEMVDIDDFEDGEDGTVMIPKELIN